MTTKIYKTTCQSETEALGASIAKALKEGDIVAFLGGLGAGKTAFSRGVLRGLGYDNNVASPTFTIVNEYRGGTLDAAHFDMYRISGEDELYSTGFYDYLDGRFLLLIEWCENIEFALADDIIRVTITGQGESGREITIEGLEL